MGKAARNEKIKLHAAFYNNLAVAFLATGIIIPVFTMLYTETRFMPIGQVVVHPMFWPIFTTVGMSIFVALCLRFMASSVLWGIQD